MFPGGAGGLVMSEVLCPRDHAERVALFRAELIGALARRELDRGELAAALRALAAEFYRPPGSPTLRRFGASTLERWLSAEPAVMRSGPERLTG
jgi:hypothetical protein